MTWYVKSKNEQGNITSTACPDWQAAAKLCEQSQVGGLPNTWIENADGQRVGFRLLTPAATKP
jgi:hypothetical protein